MKKREIFVRELKELTAEKQPTEFVERKGIGHPDSIADGLAEEVSRTLCREYLKEFGYILHHNTDEVQIVGGHSAPRFGGGIVLEPVYVLLVGRATSRVGPKRMPVRSIAVRSARDYLRRNFHALNTDVDVMIDCKIGEGSEELKNVYNSKRRLANDTSFGVGYAPLTETERITLESERLINGRLKSRFPEVGEDVKVMSCRNGDEIKLTVAAAMVDRFVPDRDHYVSMKEELADRLLDNALSYTNRKVSIEVNTADDLDRDVFYLTVTGLSMENGDDGSVGRGNRVNGLITPHRQMSMEAACGKNPVTHVGKLYQALAMLAAQDIYREYEGSIEEVYVHLLSQIGRSIDHPQSCSIQIVPSPGFSIEGAKAEIEALMNERLENINKLTELIVNDKIKMF
jgi:S-adenosylmethionine synthetase